jgi:hypothetical protein
MTDWSVLAQLFYSGAYQIFSGTPSANTAYTDGTTPVEVQRGVKLDGECDPGSCTFRIHDPADRFRPSNAASDLYGVTRPYMRGAFASASSVRFTGEVSDFRPGQTADHQESAGLTVRGNRWVDVELGGLLARIGLMRQPLASPQYQHITDAYGPNLRGYFPGEDERDATQLANAGGGAPASFANVTPGEAEHPAGSRSALKLSSTSAIRWRYGAMSTTAGYQIFGSFYITSTSTTKNTVMRWRDSFNRSWLWQMAHQNYGLVVTASDGTVLLADTYAGYDSGQWISFRILVEQSGGNLNIEPAWYNENAPVITGTTTSFAGSVGRPVDGQVPAGAAILQDAYLCHFGAVTGTTDDLLSAPMVAAINGHAGETAADRFTRLMDLRGFPYVLRGDADRSVQMGPQPVATLSEQLEEIRRTEDGLIFDRGGNIGVIFCLLNYRQEQAYTPAMTLAYPSEVGGLAETTTARDLYNDVTVENRNGSSARAQLETGPLSVEDPPDGAGREDKTVKVNVHNEALLPGIAAWWLRRYTVAGARYDNIVIDLDSITTPDLTDVQALDVGMCVEVTGRTPDPLLLEVRQIRETRSRKRSKIMLGVADARVLRAGVYGDSGSRYDSRSTTVAGAHTSGDTTIAVSTVYTGDTWNTAGGYSVTIAGETMSVTSATAPAGTGPYTQTLTVTRATNGVVKALPDGAEVHLLRQVRYGWGISSMATAGSVISGSDLGFKVWDDEGTDENIGTSYSALSAVCGVTFTVPPSGKIVITVSARFDTPVNNTRIVISSQLALGSSIGSGTVIAGPSDDAALEDPQSATASTARAETRMQASFARPVDGLTPGTVMNAVVMCKAFSGTTGTVFQRQIMVEGVPG